MTNQRRLTQHKTAEHENQNRTEISEGRSLFGCVCKSLFGCVCKTGFETG